MYTFLRLLIFINILLQHSLTKLLDLPPFDTQAMNVMWVIWTLEKHYTLLTSSSHRRHLHRRMVFEIALKYRYSFFVYTGTMAYHGRSQCDFLGNCLFLARFNYPSVLMTDIRNYRSRTALLCGGWRDDN